MRVYPLDTKLKYFSKFTSTLCVSVEDFLYCQLFIKIYICGYLIIAYVQGEVLSRVLLDSLNSIRHIALLDDAKVAGDLRILVY